VPIEADRTRATPKPQERMCDAYVYFSSNSRAAIRNLVRTRTGADRRVCLNKVKQALVARGMQHQSAPQERKTGGPGGATGEASGSGPVFLVLVGLHAQHRRKRHVPRLRREVQRRKRCAGFRSAGGVKDGGRNVRSGGLQNTPRTCASRSRSGGSRDGHARDTPKHFAIDFDGGAPRDGSWPGSHAAFSCRLRRCCDRSRPPRPTSP
jgi:hypothetical protein